MTTTPNNSRLNIMPWVIYLLVFIGWTAAVFCIGYIVGANREFHRLWAMCQSQQDRGDYWYDRYMLEVTDDWSPMSDDFYM